MKIFIKKLFLFSLFLAFILICDISVRIVFLNHSQLIVGRNIKTIFVGSSHFACDINDSLLASSKNIASAGERYLYTYIKLKKILDDNPNIATVFCSCAPLDVFPHADYYNFDSHIDNFVPRYFPLFSLHEYIVFRNSGRRFITGLFCKYHSMYHFSPLKYLKAWGGYTKLNGRAKQYAPIKEVTEGTNTIQLEYLQKIISLCKERNKKLVMMLTPNQMLESVYDMDYYYQIVKSLNVEFVDLHLWGVQHPEYFYDAGHLNEEGANAFTLDIANNFIN